MPGLHLRCRRYATYADVDADAAIDADGMPRRRHSRTNAIFRYHYFVSLAAATWLFADDNANASLWLKRYRAFSLIRRPALIAAAAPRYAALCAIYARY